MYINIQPPRTKRTSAVSCIFYISTLPPPLVTRSTRRATHGLLFHIRPGQYRFCMSRCEAARNRFSLGAFKDLSFSRLLSFEDVQIHKFRQLGWEERFPPSKPFHLPCFLMVPFSPFRLCFDFAMMLTAAQTVLCLQNLGSWAWNPSIPAAGPYNKIPSQQNKFSPSLAAPFVSSPS